MIPENKQTSQKEYCLLQKEHKGNKLVYVKNRGGEGKPNLTLWLQADSSGRAKINIRHSFKPKVKFWPKSGPELNNKMGNRTGIKRRRDTIDGIAT